MHPSLRSTRFLLWAPPGQRPTDRSWTCLTEISTIYLGPCLADSPSPIFGDPGNYPQEGSSIGDYSLGIPKTIHPFWGRLRCDVIIFSSHTQKWRLQHRNSQSASFHTMIVRVVIVTASRAESSRGCWPQFCIWSQLRSWNQYPMITRAPWASPAFQTSSLIKGQSCIQNLSDSCVIHLHDSFVTNKVLIPIKRIIHCYVCLPEDICFSRDMVAVLKSPSSKNVQNHTQKPCTWHKVLVHFMQQRLIRM